jgi:1-deoxy-D-xylulose-5-phosphate reductoisomerase
MRGVTVLGATGSVGASTLDLVARHPDRYRVVALTANGNVARLAELARQFQPAFVAVGDASRLGDLRAALDGTGIACGAGEAALIEAAARPADWTMAAIVGAAGLAPTLAAVERGGAVALANKEALVCAGDVMLAAVRRHGATLLPVDSEHNAIFQVFDFDRPEGVERIILTASGGPFRTASHAAMAAATPEQAVAHPVWSMGAKISVDSATLMNKGLELIEAARLFPVPEERIAVLVHPQSVIHSMVEYRDGSVLAQLGSPDMRIPIAHALAWPARMPTPAPRLDLAKIGSLTFELPDLERFPALVLARAALRAGGSAPAVLNAANEVAVAAFLARRIGFLDIARIVEQVGLRLPAGPLAGLDDVMAADAAARRVAADALAQV